MGRLVLLLEGLALWDASVGRLVSFVLVHSVATDLVSVVRGLLALL